MIETMISIEVTTNHKIIAELNEIVQNWHHIHYPDHFKPFEAVTIGRALKELMQEESTTVFLAKYENRPCGYALCMEMERAENAFQYSHRYVQLDQIAVMPEFQSQSVGIELILTVEAFAKNKGISMVQLNHWEGNVVASNFFLKRGFHYYNRQMSKSI